VDGPRKNGYEKDEDGESGGQDREKGYWGGEEAEEISEGGGIGERGELVVVPKTGELGQ